jgi:hypothetical protein
LTRSMRTPVLVPCLALGRSLEIFGTLTNILEGSVVYPLCLMSPGDVSSAYLLLKVPRRLAAMFPENAVADELAAFNHKHFPGIVSIGHQLCFTDEQHDRVDACLLLGGDRSALSATVTSYQRFRRGLQTSGDWETFGLTEAKIVEAEKTLAPYFPA